MDGKNTKSFWRPAFKSVMACLVFVACALSGLATVDARAETRSLKLYFLHTGERAEITYKRNGRYIDGGLKKINRFLRDWRRNEPTKMDPRLLDLVWEVYKESGSRKHIHVISAYRSPATNSLLRKRGRGVAKKSQHTLGKAMDFFIPGVSLRKLRNIALKKGLGGVGYYPKSGSPFIHMDTGRVRHWPRMSRSELARVFPNGKTLHVPTDGKPLARYNQAKAEYERKVRGSNKIVIAKAEEIEKRPNLFARVLGRDDEDEGAVAATTPRRVQISTTRPGEERSTPQRRTPEPAPAPVPATTVSEPAPQPEPLQEPTPEPVPTPETLLAALPASALPVPAAAPRSAPESTQQESVIAEVEELLPAEPDTETVDTDGTVQIASIVPARRPGEELDQPQAEPQIAAIEPEDLPELTPQPAAFAQAETDQSVVGLFTPNEIEDLRREVYAAIRAERANIPARPVPAEAVGSDVQPLEIARLEQPANQTVSDDKLSLLPPNEVEPAIAEEAISAQIKNPEPLEPGVKAKGLTPVPAIAERTPSPTTTEIASLEPLEPEVSEVSGTAIPAPNPDRAIVEDEPETISEIITAGVAIPSRANRPQAISDVRNASLRGSQTTQLGLEQFKSANLDERLVGKWALAADTSISKIADIQPPAYGRNILRELPDTVLSSGFSPNNLRSTNQGFTGSSIEFLDFTRFK